MAFGVYVHWPFCLSKCPYCDFNSHVAETIDQSRWLAAYKREIAHTAQLTGPRQVDTIFFGGGTPSIMNPETVHGIIEVIGEYWTIAPDVEITLEANPTSVEAEKFEGFKQAGVNRLSMGIQSLNEDDLKFLGRTHDTAQARGAVELAAKTFDRFSFDLIYARPGQTVDAWKAELKEALSMTVGHLSLYQLTIEKGTAFYTSHFRGDFKIPEEELAADLYDATQEVMDAAGLPAYEVSNHARKGEESRHNLIYWRYDDYAGIGPGAHGRLTLNNEKAATRTHRAPELWLERVERGGHGLHPFEYVEAEQRLQEALMMGLRLSEGVPLSRLAREYDGDIFEVLDSRKIEKLKNEGLLLNTADLTASIEGRKCLNGLLRYLLT